jgi:hypothetical protein
MRDIIRLSIPFCLGITCSKHLDEALYTLAGIFLIQDKSDPHFRVAVITISVGKEGISPL